MHCTASDPANEPAFFEDSGVLNLSAGMNRQGWCGWNRKFGLESDMPNQMWVELRSGVSWVE